MKYKVFGVFWGEAIQESRRIIIIIIILFKLKPSLYSEEKPPKRAESGDDEGGEDHWPGTRGHKFSISEQSWWWWCFSRWRWWWWQCLWWWWWSGRLCVCNKFLRRLKIEGHFWRNCHSFQIRIRCQTSSVKLIVGNKMMSVIIIFLMIKPTIVYKGRRIRMMVIDGHKEWRQSSTALTFCISSPHQSSSLSSSSSW